MFRAAVPAGAAGIILVHNHPSGDPTPSPGDRAVTRQLVDAGQSLDVPVYDHVLASDRYLSSATAGFVGPKERAKRPSGPDLMPRRT